MSAADPIIVPSLAAAWIISTAVYLRSRFQSEGAIKLPLNKQSNGTQASYGSLFASQSNGIASHDDEDEPDEDALIAEKGRLQAIAQKVSGEPIHEHAFRRQVRFRMGVLLVLSVAILALDAEDLAWASAVTRGKPHSPYRLLIPASDALIRINTLLIIATRNSQSHWSSVIHLCLLTAITLVARLASLIIPRVIDPTKDVPLLDEFSAPINSLSALFLATLAFTAAWTTPAGPPRIYSPRPGTTPARAVAGAKGVASFWDRIYFKYCWTIIAQVRAKGSLVFGDVPYLSSDMRSEVLNAEFDIIYRRQRRQANRKAAKSKKLDSKVDPWPLVWSLFIANKTPLLRMCTLSVPVGVSFYAPAFFLKSLVEYIEVIEGEGLPDTNTSARRLSQGLMFCFGLAIFLIVGATLQSQMWAVMFGELISRLKIQMQTMVFAKTLRKKAISGVGGDEDDEKGDKKEASKEGDKDAKKEDVKDAKKEEDASEFKSKAQVIQLSTVDADRISGLARHSFAVLVAPVEIATGGFLIISLLGWSALIGLVLSFCFTPILYLFGKANLYVQDKLQGARDRRVTFLNEALSGIRQVKFSAWEAQTCARILRVREKELKYQRLTFIVNTGVESLMALSPIVASLSAFGFYTFVFGHKLTPSVAFTGVAVLQELRYSLVMIPESFTAMVQAFVSVRRISTYLESGEVPLELLRPEDVGEPSRTIALNSATIGWSSDDKPSSETTAGSSVPGTPKAPFTLQASVTFETGQINLICGRLGSGKSLLLLALLGEAEVLTGSVSGPRSTPDAIRGDEESSIARSDWIRSDLVAYVPQSAFLTNGSVKKNILFGLPLDEKRYQATIKACQLLPDLSIFEDGDDQEIGSDGIGLSGGQRTRVSLARAVYSRAGTLIFDDILSNVDAHTSSKICSELLQGPLCKDRTVLLVSHHVHLIAPIAAKVVLLDDGRVKYDGDPLAFLESELYTGVEEEKDKDGKKSGDDNKAVVQEIKEGSEEPSGMSTKLNGPGASTISVPGASGVEQPARTSPRRLVEDEKYGKGQIPLKVYLQYLRAAGWVPVVTTALCYLVFASWPVVTNLWLRQWMEDTSSRHPKHPVLWWYSRWAYLCTFEVVIFVAHCTLVFWVSLRASRKLFKSMLSSVFNAPMRFHDTVPRGRLLNRFGRDMEKMDEELAGDFSRFFEEVLAVGTSLVAVVIGTRSFAFLGMFILLVPLYWLVGRSYVATTRDLRRLDAVSRSPIISSFSDLVTGLTVVRAFGGSAYTFSSLLARIDENSAYEWWTTMVGRWIQQQLNSISGVLIFGASVIIVANPTVTAAQAGFALSFLITMNHHIVFTLGSFAMLEQRLVSVERVVEFSEGLESEPPAILEPRPPAAWPQGGIEVEDLRIRYAPELPEVLKGITFSIAPGTKVGIVGATGSGKTTFATALFRFVDPSAGRILLDGIDISKVGLSDLRSRIQIVPQDPVILSGPLRGSLDVFDEYTDDEIIAALKQVHLLRSPTGSVHEGQEGVSVGASSSASPLADADPDANRNVFEDLSYPVAEGGSNLSNGQRQLVCLARALLKRSKLIVFDEASSSVDYETEEALSRTISDAFAGSTMLTIAHRLRTIIEFDKVLVMHEGTIAENASPAELLRDDKSRFYKLCSATGPEFESLQRLAFEAEKTRSAKSH